jgi:poly(A) polymerase
MPKRDLPNLADETWLNEPRLQHVLRALNVVGETRIAGGAIRNTLLREPVADIDLATTLLPDAVGKIAKAAGCGVHPTGIEHGTVTLTYQGAVFEVTTLRKDVETDGRHAVVSFSQDWAEDAQRRDFTMNAMYCDVGGKIYDYTNGYADIVKRKVRFVGTASARIREDYLRILRFFRFHARYGNGAPDEAGLNASTRLKAGIKNLSAERVRQEMLKLLEAAAAVKTLKVMASKKILKTILPHTDEWRSIDRLPVDGLLRLFVLAEKPLQLKESFRLSNAQAARLEMLHVAPIVSPGLTERERRQILYQLGPDAWRDAVALSFAKSRTTIDDEDWKTLRALPDHWTIPTFPIKGSHIIAAGVEPGPQVRHLMTALEDWWIASDFAPTQDDLLGRIGRYRN